MAQPTGRVPERNVLTTISLMVLIGVEVFAVAISGGWALAGLFELGDHVGYGLMVAFGLLAAWLMLRLWQKALAADLSR